MVTSTRGSSSAGRRVSFDTAAPVEVVSPPDDNEGQELKIWTPSPQRRKGKKGNRRAPAETREVKIWSPSQGPKTNRRLQKTNAAAATTTTTTKETVVVVGVVPSPEATMLPEVAAATAVTPAPKRSWSPLRRSRKHKGAVTTVEKTITTTITPDKNKGRSAPVTPSRARTTSTTTSTTPTTATTTTASPRRRGWFGGRRARQAVVVPPPTQTYRQQALERETVKLVRTLVSSPSPGGGAPLSAEKVQEAYLKAIDLQEECHQLKTTNTSDKAVSSPQERKAAATRIQQLQMELSAAQKAASHLAADNQKYEDEQYALAEKFEAAQAKIFILERLHQELSADPSYGSPPSQHTDDLDALRDQLLAAKRAMVEMQAENTELSKVKQTTMEEDRATEATEVATEGSDNATEDSFELQLNLQKELAKITARVHRLEEENALYAEKQRKMEDLLKSIAGLEEEKDKLVNENEDLKSQLVKEKAEKLRAVQAAKVAPSHKDMVLSSSQLATATTIIGRLTEECKTLSEREKELRGQLKRLETKNKNQKDIFHTALEIKQVEMKIYEQESKMSTRRVDELNQTVVELRSRPERSVPAPVAIPTVDPTAMVALRRRLNETENKLRYAESHNQDMEDRIDSLEEELQDRQLRVSQLEEVLDTQTEALKVEMEQETAHLSNQISELSSLIRGKDDELHKMQDELDDERKESEYRTQVRVNELNEQLHEYEMSLEEREERIHHLEEKVSVQDEQLAKRKASPRSVNDAGGLEEEEGSTRLSKLDALRAKIGQNERLMRAKLDRVQEIDRASSFDDGISPTAAGNNSRENSPEPMMVFATPVSDERVIEMVASLRTSEKRIDDLQSQLADAQARLSQVQDTTQEATDERYADMEKSLNQGEERIRDLKFQLAKAQTRLNEAAARKMEQQETEAKGDLATAEQQEEEAASLRRLLESLQESSEEVTRLRSKVVSAEGRIQELQSQQNDLSRDESAASSARDLAEINALQEDMEEHRQKFEDESDKRKAALIKIESVEKERDGALQKLQDAELKLLAKESAIDEMVRDLDEAKSTILNNRKHMRKNSLIPEGRVARLEAELADAREQLTEADMKIEMMEKFIEEEVGADESRSNNESAQVEADIQRKDEQMKLLRTDTDRVRKDLLRAKERVENLEMERNYSTAKLKELSSVVQTKAGTEAEIQLYNKCIECAELSADKDDLSNKLRSGHATIKRLEQEIKATQEMVTGITQSWDTMASADENISRLKKEHQESIAKATTLSIELAESQMEIHQLADKLSSAERANKAYAEELNGRTNLLSWNGMTGRSNSRQSSHSPERREESTETRRMKQRIALLEDENAAYSASLTAFKSMQ
jgi:chromosome segregation ATPase